MIRQSNLLNISTLLILISTALFISACGGGGSGSTTGASVPTPVVSPYTLPSGLTDNISPNGQTAGSSRVKLDNNGNAIIAWEQSDGSNLQVFMSEYRSGSWTHPSGLTDNISPDGQDGFSQKIAIDDNGNAIIAWKQNDGSNDQIFISEYRSGSWTHPSGLADNISFDGQHARFPQVAMDNNGNAIIVWRQNDGSNHQIFKSEYRSGSWTHPSGLADNISPDGQSTYNPQVAMDDNGNAIIVWIQSDGTNNQIFMSEYRSGSWTHPSGLADNISPDGQDADYPQVALDNNSNALITWEQNDSSNDQIFMSEYRSGSWTHPSGLADNISPDGQNAVTTQVTMDNNSNAIIVWEQSDASTTQIFKSEYRSGSWTHPSGLTDNISPDGQSGGDAQVAMDNNSNAVIVWKQSDGSNNQIFISEYRSGSWTNPSGLTDNLSPNGQHAGSPQVAMDDNDDAVIVWEQPDGSNYQIFMSEYR